MKVTYLALNKNRPKFLAEIIINSLDLLGPSPELLDVKHLTSVLSSIKNDETYVDASFVCEGPIEATAETCVYIDWPKQYRIPVTVKAVVHCFSAKVRLKFNSQDLEENWL